MLILGLLLIIVALVVFGYLFFGTSDLEPLDIDLGVFTVELTPLHLFLLGAATLVVLVLGLLLLTLGLRAQRRRRREVKELRKVVEQRPAPEAEASPDRDHLHREPETARDREMVHRDTRAAATEPAPYEREVPQVGNEPTTDRPRVGERTDDTDRPPINLPSDHRDPHPEDRRQP